MRATVGPRERERFLAGLHVEHGAHFIARQLVATATCSPSGLSAVSIAAIARIVETTRFVDTSRPGLDRRRSRRRPRATHRR